MRRTLSIGLVMLSAAFLGNAAAWGWWDTQIMSLREVPKTAEVEAEVIASGGAAVVDDQPGFGPLAGGGKAVRLEPGKGALIWKVKLSRSVYKLLTIGRVSEANPAKNGAPEWPMFARMRVTGPDAKVVGDWSMPINYLNSYYDTARMFFPAHAEGEYTIEFSITGESKANLTVDRLELRDELGNTLKKGFKNGRYLWSNDQIAQIRRNAKGPQPGQEPKLDPSKRAERVETFHKLWGAGYEKWNTSARGMELWNKWVKTGDMKYLQTGDPQLALELAQMLLQAADWYPALDWSAQITDPKDLGNVMSRGIRFSFTAGRFGKIQYSGWEIGYPDGFAKIYDAIFPFILENADELVAMAQQRVPWIKSKDDLIAFLDTNLLQYTGDCVNRNILRCSQGGSEMMMLHAIAAQGPSPAGERLARWLYTRTYWDTTNDGGIQDQAITGRLRDGSNNIGSIGYTMSSGQVLVAAAELMGRYIAAGGSKEFDLSDTQRFPAVMAGAFFPVDCRVAGGYRPNIGDWGRAIDPRINGNISSFADCIRFAWQHTRDPRMAWLMLNVVKRTDETDAEWQQVTTLAAGQRDPQLATVSRNLEGFGLAILEAGADQNDFTKKRALTFRHGAGKGHAHADSLGLEYFAHGARAVLDAGSRGGAPHPGHMSAHLGVTVDDADMRNTGEINVSGTAWTTAFAPRAGVQYVAGAARFANVPQVSRYERQAALIDIDGTDESYVFDVLRVAGGKQHIWSTHGPARTPADKPEFNFQLKPAASPEAIKALDRHLDPREGVAGTIAQATWPTGKEFEQRMLEGAFQAGQTPIFTRATLLDHQGDPVFVGDSDADRKGLEGSQWACTVGLMHVQKTGAQGLETVWPQIIESYRGQSALKSIAAVPVTPADTSAAAPVAVSVETTRGQKDLLVADGNGAREVKAGDLSMVGQFGYVSQDAKGLRLAHLIGGTKLEQGKFKIAASDPGYQAKIVSADYLNRRIRLDKPLPAGLLDGQEFLIGAPAHPQVWKSVKVEGDTLTHQYSAVLYQSEILSVDEAAGEVVCSMNPNMLLAAPHYFDGVTAVDETGQHFWRVKTMKPKYIFMYLQEPYQDWRQTFSEADFPDSNGDGKRMVTFTNWGGGDGSPALEKVEIEVARVDRERQVIYFKLPENAEVVQANGWQWAGSRMMDPAKGRWMINEAGKKWIPNYTGKQNVIVLEGAVKNDDFTDADKDGRRVLRMYHFGPGDMVSVKSHVYVARQTDGSYKLDATTPVTVTLPDGKTLTR